MKNLNRSVVALMLTGLLGCVFLAGCCNSCREKVVTYGVTNSGENWAESQTIQERRGPGGKKAIEKQSIYEEIRCMRKGVEIRARSPEACIKAGGSVVENVIVDEKEVRKK